MTGGWRWALGVRKRTTARNENESKGGGGEGAHGGGEFFPGRFEGLGEDTGGADHGHEVAVAVPAGDDVAVEMVDAAAGDGTAEVESDVEGVGFEGGGKEAFAEGDFLEEVGTLGRSEVFEIGNVAERDGEEVAGIVGETIENEVGKGAAMNDERGTVVAEGGKLRERAFHRGRVAWRFDVFHAPVRVELLHVRWAMAERSALCEWLKAKRVGRKGARGGEVKAAGGRRKTERLGDGERRRLARGVKIRACALI